MTKRQMTFQRYEIKYLLDNMKYKELQNRLCGKMEQDQYGKTLIGNIYFDTPDFRLIRQSLEKPVYKEKLRLRSYGIPQGRDQVFAELKKKYCGVVYKRREELGLWDAEAYLYRHRPAAGHSQVIKEIDWMFRYYPALAPAMYISYQRVAMYGCSDPDFRLTFDGDILWRRQELYLDKGAWGEPLLGTGQRLMEVKVASTLPLWFAKILNELEIYPMSYSKYGTAYQKMLEKQQEKRGVGTCA